MKNLTEYCSFEEFSKFETVAKANDWSDETMEHIYYDLIKTEKIKMRLTDNSYSILR